MTKHDEVLRELKRVREELDGLRRDMATRPVVIQPIYVPQYVPYTIPYPQLVPYYQQPLYTHSGSTTAVGPNITTTTGRTFSNTFFVQSSGGTD